MAKRKQKLKTKIKKKHGVSAVCLADINLHAARLAATLRALADRIDELRSVHMDVE